MQLAECNWAWRHFYATEGLNGTTDFLDHCARDLVLSAIQGRFGATLSDARLCGAIFTPATSGPPPPLPPLPPELAQKEPLPDCQGDAANHSHVPICQEPSPESQTAASRQASMGGSCSCRVRLQVPTQDEDDFTAEESGNKHPLTRCLCSLCCRITLSCCEERRLEQQSEEARASVFSSCDSS